MSTSLSRRLSISKAPEDPLANNIAAESAHAKPQEPSMKEEEIPKINLTIKQAVPKRVCVFSDRAQVERIFKVEAPALEERKEKEKEERKKRQEDEDEEPSPLLVILSDVPQGAHDSSIRISKLSGIGTILEVAIENRQKEVLSDDNTDLVVEETKAEAEARKKETDEKKKKKIEELTKREALLQEELARLEKEKEWVESYAQQQNHPTSGVKLGLDKATEFLTFYLENLEKYDAKKDELEAELVEVAQARSQLVRIKNVKTLYLLLGDAEGSLEFSLSYVMSNASWRPSYDIRVASSSLESVELTYHGIITNSTGEDWKDVELSLSTAQPQLGGGPPPIPTLNVRIYVPRMVYKSRAKKGGFPLSISSGGYYEASEEDESGTMVAEPINNATSTTFKIPRIATINYDYQPHKVTISIVELKGTFSHTIIPQPSQHAYLRSKTINKSGYPFLAGKANVFMDDTFIATSELKTTNPGEELSLYLGSDPTVVVEFKEVIFQSSKGIVNKVTAVSYLHEIVIKNTKSKAILCDIFDQLPKSQEDKIKVTPIKPPIEDKEREGGCVLVSQTNSLRWRKTILPGDKFEINFEYRIEFPQDRQIDFVA